MRAIVRSFVPIMFVLGCHPAVEPHGASVAEHDRQAREHESAAVNLEAECARQKTPTGPCWKNRDKATIAAHRDAASQHRVASAALEAAESQACVGISDDDRAMSPFEHPADIASVEPLVERTSSSKLGLSSRQVGAVVRFRAVPGLTGEWLQRLVDCHLARNAALGHIVPEMPDCPLVPRGVQARVRSIGNGFAVEIRSDDSDTAREILARAQRLVTRETTSQR